MAFIACAGCGREVNAALDRCPSCGTVIASPGASADIESRRRATMVARLRSTADTWGHNEEPDAYPPFPVWVAFTVPIAIFLVVFVGVLVDARSDRARIPDDDLVRSVLQPWEAPASGPHLVSYWQVDDDLRRLGVVEAFHAVFSDIPRDDLEGRRANGVWSEGDTYVWSVAMQFSRDVDAVDAVDVIWKTYAIGALERQRGPDGSLLMFHPEYQEVEGAPIIPIAVAAWREGATVMMMTRFGATSTEDVLSLARLVQDHIETVADGGDVLRPVTLHTDEELSDAALFGAFAGDFPDVAPWEEWLRRFVGVGHPDLPVSLEACLADQSEAEREEQVSYRYLPESLTPSPGWVMSGGANAGEVPSGRVYSVEVIVTDDSGTYVVTTHVSILDGAVRVFRDCG